MTNRLKLYAAFLAGGLFVLAMLFATSAQSAEADLKVRAEIIRCVTVEEAVKACDERQACCEYVEERTVAEWTPEKLNNVEPASGEENE